MSVSSVLFGEEGREWGVAEELDMRLTLEITIDRQDMYSNIHTQSHTYMWAFLSARALEQ